MTFDEILEQITALLKRHGRVSYRALKMRFEEIDDDYLDVLKEEILYVHESEVQADDRGFAWTGETEATPVMTNPPNQPEPQPIVEQAQPVQATSSPVAPRTLEAERRQLTVMFVYLVGSTRLSGELDPEDLRDVVRAYHSACTDVITRYHGHVAQHLGDGLLVYFGYPQAHEDDPQRAVHTGLGIATSLKRLNARLAADQGIQLSIRMGIHTGLVVIGDMGSGERQEQLALGETPNIAARIQGLAEPDTVIISEATYRLVQGYFACEALGEHDLRGVSQS
jgi:class 3 adenylate cyclase